MVPSREVVKAEVEIVRHLAIFVQVARGGRGDRDRGVVRCTIDGVRRGQRAEVEPGEYPVYRNGRAAELEGEGITWVGAAMGDVAVWVSAREAAWDELVRIAGPLTRVLD